MTLLVLCKDCKATFDLVERLYTLFQEGIVCVHQRPLHPTPREVRVQLLKKLNDFFVCCAVLLSAHGLPVGGARMV